jgi:hypothetical protein
MPRPRPAPTLSRNAQARWSPVPRTGACGSNNFLLLNPRCAVCERALSAAGNPRRCFLTVPVYSFLFLCWLIVSFSVVFCCFFRFSQADDAGRVCAQLCARCARPGRPADDGARRDCGVRRPPGTRGGPLAGARDRRRGSPRLGPRRVDVGARRVRRRAHWYVVHTYIFSFPRYFS